MYGYERKKPYKLISITLVIAVFALLIKYQKIDIKFVDFVHTRFFMPVQSLFVNTRDSVGGTIDYYKNLGNIKGENELLKEENEKLKFENNNLLKLKSENERLRDFLSFREKNNFKEVTGADVIGKSISNVDGIILINRGLDSEIEEKMVVVSNSGLVGHVIEVHENFSKVMLITDVRSSISVETERTLENGVLKGAVEARNKGKLVMEYIDVDSDIIEGDKVHTSNLSSLYPKGLYIGEVEIISENIKELNKTAVVKPDVDYNNLREVLILKKENEVE
ncbi:MAG: rod shape-determining protein MreC [Clostridia bacterium]|jgi:rod shape-determining protein MreC|nr:rod shape-determining protein MreC [Clostridia bacterium]